MDKRVSKRYHLQIFNILSISWIAAIIPAFLLILLLPALLQKYKLELIQITDTSKTHLLTFYEDLDHNGTKEKLDILDYRGKFACCLASTDGLSLIRQYNFYGKVPIQENLSLPIFTDINGDGINELFVFTQSNDSIFLNGADFSTQQVILYGRFISKIGMVANKKDFVLRPIINHDNNGDGIPEIYFLLNGCYSLYPRQIMAYDVKNDTLIKSVNTGCQHYVTPVILPDNQLIFISTTPATDNCPSKFCYPYKDNCAWLFGFNDHLEFIFDPIAFPGIGCSVHGPIKIDGEYIYTVFNQGEKENFIFSMNMKGEILRKKKISSPIYYGKIKKIIINNQIHYLLQSDNHNLYNTLAYNPVRMDFEQDDFTKKQINSSLTPFDLDQNKKAYLMDDYKTNRTKLLLDDCTQEFSFESNLYVKPFNLYIQTKDREQGKLIMVTNRTNLYTYLLTTTWFYPFRFIVYALIYLLCVGIIFITKLIYKRHQHKQEQLKQEIVSLQLQLVNSQLDPHFAFNALNLIASKILTDERLEAYDLMSCLTDMMHSAISFSDKVSWSLDEELKFISDYLILMKERFHAQFDYSIECDPNINMEKVCMPRLLVQNAVENSIKHAFQGIDKNGMIIINTKQESNSIEISITDNGIGREKALLSTNHFSKKGGNGIRLNKKQIEIYNKLYLTNIVLETRDLYSNSLASGTQTILTIPLPS